MTLEEVQEILIKYEKEERKINDILNKHITKKDEYVKGNLEKSSYVPLNEAVERNKQILKDLETVKGTLRSKAVYTPIEMHWEDICKKYREAPSLPVTTWRCHLPVFV